MAKWPYRTASERPELENDLSAIFPTTASAIGCVQLSGWLVAPCASSIEDSDLKLSYDLYYLRHFSTC